eukprot:1179422-Prorocentrum_minimum.AAC.2
MFCRAGLVKPPARLLPPPQDAPPPPSIPGTPWGNPASGSSHPPTTNTGGQSRGCDVSTSQSKGDSGPAGQSKGSASAVNFTFLPRQEVRLRFAPCLNLIFNIRCARACALLCAWKG